jgi:Lamin Tail Domain/CotH kinase protein
MTLRILAALLISAAAFALPPNDAVVTFNEIHYNPAGSDEAGEWIEVANQMAVNVDLAGWRISGGADFIFPNIVIPGGGRIVIAKTPGLIAGSLGPFEGALSNSGDTLRLRDNNDRVMDELTYGDKGEWPVAPDGGGVTLAKRSQFSNSARPASWTSSDQLGGTPGAVNFPPPPPPVKTRPVARDAAWKYTQTVPAADWNTAAYDDSAWAGGQAGLHFGNPQIYMDSPPVVQGGIWTVKPWTNDATSEISTAKSYTHKIGLNRATTYAAINGVVFDSPGTGVTSGANWSLLGATLQFNNNRTGQGANFLPVGTGSFQLCQEFLYGNSYNSKSRIELTNLTPGQSYIFTLYGTGFGDPPVRRNLITPSDTGAGHIVDQNATRSGNGLIAKYHYKASGDGTIAFDFLPLDSGTWHHYAFSNEVAAAVPAEIEVTGVAVSGSSSQLTTGGFTRGAANTVNGSGVNGQTHGTTPDGTMWLTNGTFTAPTDPLPADITFDLGSVVNLTSFHVWNYNELNLPARGSNQVQVQTATAPAGPFTTVATVNFIRASSLATEPGQHIEVAATGIRYVRFNILTGHGGDNSFVGLSEVKFYKAGVAGPAVPVPLREKLTSLYNTGVNNDHTLASPGTNDLHYTNVTQSLPAVVQTGHPAWLGPDGVAQWTGLTANGTENVLDAQFTWRTTADFSAFQPGTFDVKLYYAADNQLDNVLLNGASKAISGAGFGGYIGPATITGFANGANTLDFVWTNAGPGVNPGGFRVKWDATAQPILAKTALPANPTTTYFRRTFTNSGLATSSYRLLLNSLVDDGAVFYVNGVEVHRTNITGTPTAATPADSDVVYPRFSGVIEVPASAIVPGTNVLAVELHQSAAGGSDAFFMAQLDMIETPVALDSSMDFQFSELAGATAGTWFVELRNNSGGSESLAGWTLTTSAGASHALSGSLAAGALLSLDEAQLGWRPLDGEKLFLNAPGAGVEGVVVKNAAQARDADGRWLVPSAGTPGTANTFSVPDSVVINEIMYHHAPAYLATGITENPEEWLELYNKSAAPVTLTGWKLRGGISFDFAAGTQIPAGGYLVVANDAAALLAKFPGITVVGPLGGGLSNSDDAILLEDSSGNPVDEVRYYDAGRWDARADGGGGSLELRNPAMDNSSPEAWAASDETGRSSWQTFSYTSNAQPPTGSNDPTNYNELVLGLLSDGECLIDDVSVTEVTVGNRQLIQNMNFSAGTAAFWRNIGNHGSHGRTVVVDDPSAPGNKVLKIVATGATEHMHNHCETTLKAGASFVPITSGNTYTISFRARWLSGSPRLHSRLYFNRIARTSLMPIPQNNGTPGAQNSRFIATAGPTFSALAHTPVLPESGAPVTVSVAAADPQGVASVALKWKTDGSPSFNTVAMTLSGSRYEGQIPGQTAGALVQFYIEASDGATTATFPAAGPASRALVRWSDGTVPTTAGHGVRILLPNADANFLHEPTNAMSNDFLPCTVVYRESEVFYDAAVRLKSSQRGRPADIRLGFALNFDPMQPFRGAHTTINLDRSGYGRGTVGSGFGHSEIITWHFMQRARGVPSMWNDLAYVIAPRSAHNGSTMLTMAEFNDVWADSQFDDGAAHPVFKYELIYFPLTTVGGGPEGLKLPSPDDVRGVEFESYNTTDKEAFRWNFLIGNARSRDDYSGIQELNQTYRLSAGAPFNNALPNTIDVDQWLRAAAALSLAGVDDNYIATSSAWHNLKLYARSDGRIVFLPWDLDFQTRPSNDPLILNSDISRITGVSAANQRLFYQHLQDIIATSFRSSYLSQWTTHYATLSTAGGNWGDILTYVDARSAHVLGLINGAVPPVNFVIGTNGGSNFSATGPNVTLIGSGWVDVRNISIQAGGTVLPVTWTTLNQWQVSVPIGPGPNTITLVATNYQGAVVGTDTITITGTGSIVPAAADNLVISEVHYHPADPTPSEISAGFTDADDFEFFELLNISPGLTVNLAGCQFVNGLTHTLPSQTLAPGARLVIPRRAAAFAMRHSGVAVAAEYYTPGGNTLSNGGEQLTLVGAGGADIARFTYGDNIPWPVEADGAGKSLVLIAPKTKPDATDPLHWRASAASNGNPGTTDALPLPGDLAGDDDGDGIPNITAHAIGAGAVPAAGIEHVLGVPHLTFTIERNPLADVNWNVESSTDLAVFDPVGTTYDITARTILGNGIERVTLRAVAPLSAPREFLHGKLTATP